MKLLSDEKLLSATHRLIEEERKISKFVIEHIAEIDIRKLYLKKGFPSLFEFLVKFFKFSEGAAQSRIDAARLIQSLPEVSDQLESGTLNLSQVTKIQRLCRKIKKETGEKVSAQTKKDVLKKLAHQGARQTDLILAQEFNTEIKIEGKQKIQKDESIRIEITFTKEEMETLRQAQSLLSHADLKGTILKLAEKLIKPNSTAAVAVKTVTPKLRKEILQRDKCCQFIDNETNRKCGSTRFLEVDHIQPRYAGGSNTRDNLRAPCRAHNQYRYRVGN